MNINNQICKIVARKYLKSKEVSVLNFETTSKEEETTRLVITVCYKNQQQSLYFLVLEKNETQNIFLECIKKVPHLNGGIVEEYFYQDDSFIIVEDLVEEGYQKSKEFNVEHLQAILSTLAKLHTVSLAHGESVKSHQKLSQDFQLAEKPLPKFRKVLVHYEITPQNVVFKELDCRFVNFHPRYYLPPMFDVLGVILSHTNEDFRQQFLHFLILHYYKSLEESLHLCNVDIKTVFSKDDLYLQIHQVLQFVKSEPATLITREECYFIAEKFLGTTDYKFKSFSVTPLDQVNGYLGDYHKLVIELETSNIMCFIKCMPKSNSAHEIVQEGGCFYKEVFFYQTFISKMNLLGVTNIKECIPECYYQRFEDVIVFEDISTSFQGYPAQVPFEFKFLKIIAQKLAKFHANTLVFEERKSKDLGKPFRLNTAYGDLTREVFFLKDETHHGAKVMQAGIASVPDVINLFPELKQKDFVNVWSKLQDSFYQLVKPSARFRNVFCHGDLWTNNIMIKFQDKEPIDCRFVDFQCSRYCPPVHDLLSLIYLTTDRATRAKHTDAIKQIYYKELGKNVELYNFKIGDLISLEEFETSYECLKPQMIVQAILYFSFIMCTSEEISSTLVDDEVTRQVFFGDRKDYLKKMCEKSVAFKHRLRESVLDLMDLCKEITTII